MSKKFYEMRLERMTKLIQQAYAEGKYSAEELAEYLLNHGVRDKKDILNMEHYYITEFQNYIDP